MELQSRPFDLEGVNAFIDSLLLHAIVINSWGWTMYYFHMKRGGLSKGMMFRKRPTSPSHASMLSFVKHLQSKASVFLRVVGLLQHQESNVFLLKWMHVLLHCRNSSTSFSDRKGGRGGHMQFRNEYCRIWCKVVDIFDRKTPARDHIHLGCHMSDHFVRLISECILYPWKPSLSIFWNTAVLAYTEEPKRNEEANEWVDTHCGPMRVLTVYLVGTRYGYCTCR